MLFISLQLSLKPPAWRHSCLTLSFLYPRVFSAEPAPRIPLQKSSQQSHQSLDQSILAHLITTRRRNTNPPAILLSSFAIVNAVLSPTNQTMAPSSPAKQPYLSQLPLELKQLIVQFLYIDEEDVWNLSGVDRTFYQLCNPFNWESIHLTSLDLNKLSVLSKEIIPRHGKHLLTFSTEEFEELPLLTLDDLVNKEARMRFFTENSQVTLLAEIFSGCPNLRALYLTSGTAPLDRHGNFTINYLEPTSRLAPTISQLTNLTFLTLKPASGERPFHEDFVAKLVKGLVNLSLFILALVEAKFPSCDYCECENSVGSSTSPLAMALAPLKALRTLDLESVAPVDSSWSRIPWQSNLRSLRLTTCFRASVPSLHGLCMLFAPSLTELFLVDVGDHDRTDFDFDFYLPQPAREKYKFCLPALTILRIECSLPVSFIELFKGCRSITGLFMRSHEEMSVDDLKGLLDVPTWTELEMIVFTDHIEHISDEEFGEIVKYGLEKEIEVEAGEPARGICHDDLRYLERTFD